MVQQGVGRIHLQVGIHCNLNYPDLIYLEPPLSGLAQDQQIL